MTFNKVAICFFSGILKFAVVTFLFIIALFFFSYNSLLSNPEIFLKSLNEAKKIQIVGTILYLFLPFMFIYFPLYSYHVTFVKKNRMAIWIAVHTVLTLSVLFILYQMMQYISFILEIKKLPIYQFLPLNIYDIRTVVLSTPPPYFKVDFLSGIGQLYQFFTSVLEKRSMNSIALPLLFLFLAIYNTIIIVLQRYFKFKPLVYALFVFSITTISVFILVAQSVVK